MVENDESVDINENTGYQETLIGPLTKPQVLKLLIPTIVCVLVAYSFSIDNVFRFGLIGIGLLVGALFTMRIHGTPVDQHIAHWMAYKGRPNNLFNKEQTKNFVDIVGIYDSTVAMRCDRYLKIVEIPGVNYEFMSSVDRLTVASIYEQFLNALPSDVQIVSRPEQYNARKYLQNLYRRLDEVKDKDPWMYDHIMDSIMFFDSLTSDIIEHRFYLIFQINLRKEASTLFAKGYTANVNEKLARANFALDSKLNSVLGMLSPLNVSCRVLEGSELVSVLSRYYGGGS